MSKIMINSISEQTIPVFQFIKEFKDIDKYLFISTEKMEKIKRVSSIIKATKIEESKIKKVIVDPESLKDVEMKLKEFYEKEIKDNDEIIINLTTGTKLMAMAVYNIFQKIDGVKIFYQAKDKNILKQIYPEKKFNDFQLTYQIRLKEYLNSYGIEVINCGEPIYSYETAKKFLNAYLNQKLNDIIPEFLKLRNSDKKTKKKLKKEGIYCNYTIIKDLLKKDKINYYDIEYITGGWFEEFVYYKIKKQYNLTDDFIGLNYQITRVYGEVVRNEFDVLYMKDNMLNIIECKTSNIDINTKRNFLQETIYKLDSLKREFGLRNKSYIYTLDKKIKESDLERAKINNIEIIQEFI